MVEDSLLYCITLFTFAVVFGFCYIRYVLTFFEKRKIPKASTPNFPLGNISDVLFGKVPFFMQLWKYHNRFKKKNEKFGGFYVFLKPAVMVVEPDLLAEKYFEALDAKPRDLGYQLETKIFELFDALPKIADSDDEDEINTAEVFREFFFESSKAIFGIESDKIERELKKVAEEASNFKKLVALAIRSSNNNKTFFLKVVDKIIRDRKKTDLKGNDVIQILIDENVSAEDIVDVSLSLVRNIEWTNNLLMFCLYELSINQEIQDDLRGEILRFQKQNGGSLNKLSYLHTVVRETLRKYPPRPFSCWQCKKTLQVEGSADLPKDILAFVSIFGIHHDAKNYTNPELFDPDRFSEENEKYIDPRKFLPFGCQTGSDFDMRFVSSIMKLCLNELIAKFKFSLGKKSLNSLKFEENMAELRPKNGMWLKLELL